MTVATKTDERRCACGTVLSASNASRECSICTRLRMDAELLDDLRAKQLLVARKVAFIYARPDQETFQRYLEDLGDALDELCDVLRLDPVDPNELPAAIV